MKLKLLSVDKAQLFGLAARDRTEADALAELAGQGCSEADARERLGEAIAAGAFARVDAAPLSAEKSKGQKEQTA